MTSDRATGGVGLTSSLALLVLVAFLGSLAISSSGIGVPPNRAAWWLILSEIRFPRACFGLLVGAGLGVAGAALQGYLRNPLAEPSVLGVSGGAALGSVIAIQSGAAAAFSLALPLAGLAGAAVSTVALLVIAGERSAPVTLMLAGVALAAVSAAGVSLVLNLSANPFAAAEAIFWMMGSLADRSTTQLYLAGPLIAVGVAILLGLGRALDALTLGDDVAASLGIDVAVLRRRVIAGTALTVGAATATTGTIGFIGLVVPHVLRPWVGHKPSKLLLDSALGGAALLLVADSAIRLLSPLVDLRVGVLTSLLGAPFFLWLVVRMRSELAP